MRSPWTKWFILTYWKYDLAVHRLDFGMFSFLLWTLSLWNSLPYILKLLDFEGSTMTSGQFEQVKHQFVWPDMLLKRLIGKTSGHWERLLVQFWAISCFFFYWDTCICMYLKKFMSFIWHTRKPPSCPSTFQVKARL